MRHLRLRPWLWLLLALGLLAWTAVAYKARSATAPTAGMVLLIADSRALAHPATQAWLDAAREEGLLLQPMTDEAFIQAQANHQKIAGVILPDTVHRLATDLLVNTLYQYTRTGGQLLVGFDAGVLNSQDGAYTADASRLSGLVGVDYALYDTHQSEMVASGPVYASRQAESELAIQPGKLAFDVSTPLGWGELTTYGYPNLVYSHYRTGPGPTARIWMQGRDGTPVVTTHRWGRGTVLFANLPLGYLKTRTDSYMLHRLVAYFARTMVRQPYLAPTPQARGGMVLNLHVDSNAAQQHLMELEQTGWFDEGPFSIHVTAGPDTYKSGDGMGLNIPNNPWMRGFLKRQHDKGHEVGNHGGWIHNVYGDLANDSNQARFEPYLQLNHDAISHAIGTQALAYSAPMGNQPDWATAWLREHGFKGYYSTADTGMGPTRSYTQGHPAPASQLWTFPISNFNRIATMDELKSHQLDEQAIRDFITQLIDHVSAQGVARLFYFHPPVSREYSHALQDLRTHAHALRDKGLFDWYSMAGLSDFMNRRETVQWQILPARNPQKNTVQAQSTASLRDMTWCLPKDAAREIRVTKGQAEIRARGGQWLVVAGDVQQLHFEWAPLPVATAF